MIAPANASPHDSPNDPAAELTPANVADDDLFGLIDLQLAEALDSAKVARLGLAVAGVEEVSDGREAEDHGKHGPHAVDGPLHKRATIWLGVVVHGKAPKGGIIPAVEVSYENQGGLSAARAAA